MSESDGDGTDLGDGSRKVEIEALVVDLAERLAAAEVRLIAQEHRPLTILNDLRKQETRSEKWWNAAFALFVRLFLTNPVVTAGAGAVAIAGAWFAYVSTKHFEAQNDLVREEIELVREEIGFFQDQIRQDADQNKRQNEFFRRQIEQEAIQDFRARRAQLLRTLYDRRECRSHERDERPGGTDCPVASGRARAAAAQTLAEMERAVVQSPDDWPGIVVQRPDLSMVDLSRTHLTGANLTGADLLRANLDGAILASANLTSATLIDADLTGAVLYWANLTRANLIDADLIDADLTRANLTDADLTRANLTRANLTKANLTGADLTGADLTGTIYCPDETSMATRWPDGFTPKSGALPAEACDEH